MGRVGERGDRRPREFVRRIHSPAIEPGQALPPPHLGQFLAKDAGTSPFWPKSPDSRRRPSRSPALPPFPALVHAEGPRQVRTLRIPLRGCGREWRGWGRRRRKEREVVVSDGLSFAPRVDRCRRLGGVGRPSDRGWAMARRWGTAGWGWSPTRRGVSLGGGPRGARTPGRSRQTRAASDPTPSDRRRPRREIAGAQGAQGAQGAGHVCNARRP